jgi:hypothetical protein
VIICASHCDVVVCGDNGLGRVRGMEAAADNLVRANRGEGGN